MAGIVPFAFRSDETTALEIRTICNDLGDPWFVLRDLLCAMNSTTKAADAKESIEQGLGNGLVADLPIVDSMNRQQVVTIVAEAAATYLVSRSNTEMGKKLNRFLHLEVLPQIRRTGGYGRELSPAETIIRQGQIMLALEQEQARQAAMQKHLESRQTTVEQRLDHIETAVDYFTVIGWHRLTEQRIALPLNVASKMGKQASIYCRDNGIKTGTIPDPRYGTVNAYPKWVLDLLFGNVEV